MDGYDDRGIFYSSNLTEGNQNDTQVNLQSIKKKFKEFIRQFHNENFDYKYRYLIL